MPRYFFSCEGAQTFTDLDGTELADRRAAELEAIRNAGEILSDHAEAFANNPWWRLTVTDEAGQAVFVLHFTAGTTGATASGLGTAT